MTPSRRGFLRGLTGFVACAPAIVRASSLMPVKAWRNGEIGAVTIIHSGSGYSSPSTITFAQELVDITRRAYVPVCVIQIYDAHPTLSQSRVELEAA